MPDKKEQQNNVDIAIEKIRQLQRAIYDYSKSPNDLFAMTNEVIEIMNKASKEIKINYEEISEQLTKKLNGKL